MNLWGPKEESIKLVGNSRLLEKFFKDKECIYVWAYESIPTIIGCGVDKVNDDVISRMLRWVYQQSSKSQTISQVFDSPILIIKAVIEMTPEEEQLKIASGELFENLRSSTIVQSKNGGSKRGKEVVNDEGDFKKSKKQKSKSKMKKAIRNLKDRVAVVEGQLTSIKSDIDELKGMMSTILKHIGLQRKDNEDVHTVGTPPWLRFNIELEKPIDVLEKKVEIGLEEPIDVVDNERILVAKWPQYKECIKENRPFDWKEEYRLVDYVVGSKEDFQDPWTSVDYIYSPFNVYANHWVLLCLDLVSCQVKLDNHVYDLRTGQGLYLNRSEWRFTPISIASEAMHRADV
ncbi:Ulp1-like peptidase [Cucumis melo var. makuwa]|uniref:Ulp1-like peptidase n=1 Tax=Cucumis melo var. makuwa TaxID=1194695 RepID=A0A5A7T644_CUCMM|nr:Ulp1-like peptidase [Cucumis melo var. makuwa]